MAQVNRMLEALKEDANLVSIAGVGALALAGTSIAPVLVGLAVETAYLLFVPDTKWYGDRLARRAEAGRRRRSEQFRNSVLPQLSEETQARYTHLEIVRSQIFSQAQTDQHWFGEVLRKLDFLLEKFLVFGQKEMQFRNYLVSIWEDRQNGRPHGSVIRFAGAPAAWVPNAVKDIQLSYESELGSLTRLCDDESDASTKAVLEKRVDVLKHRHEFVGKIGRILTNLNYQMELLEDTFGLINDQIRARSPEQVLSDIEGVVYQTESMTELLDELTPFEQMAVG